MRLLFTCGGWGLAAHLLFAIYINISRGVGNVKFKILYSITRVGVALGITVEAIAENLGLSKEELIKSSVRTYLESELRRLNAEIVTVYHKYGVKSLEELDERVSRGMLSETETFEDFTKLDHLEDKRDKIEGFLRAMG